MCDSALTALCLARAPEGLAPQEQSADAGDRQCCEGGPVQEVPSARNTLGYDFAPVAEHDGVGDELRHGARFGARAVEEQQRYDTECNQKICGCRAESALGQEADEYPHRNSEDEHHGTGK